MMSMMPFGFRQFWTYGEELELGGRDVTRHKVRLLKRGPGREIPRRVWR